MTQASVGDAAFYAEVQAARAAMIGVSQARISFVSHGVPRAVAQGLLRIGGLPTSGPGPDDGVDAVLAAFGRAPATRTEGSLDPFWDSGSERSAFSDLGETSSRVGEPASPGPDPRADDPGPLGDRRRVIEELGRGAFARVVAAWDEGAQQRVALKVTQAPEPAVVRRFMGEFARAEPLNHPNLVAVYGLEYAPPNFFIVMEEVSGATGFVDWIRGPDRLRGGPPVPPDPARLSAALLQLVDGLEELHRRGLVHLDIKPPNVLIDLLGRLKIVDFGLAQEAVRMATRAGFAGGTLPYMPLEQLQGEPLGPAADWYAVGVMLFEALTGSLPAQGNLTEEYREARRFPIRVAPSTLVPGIDPALDEVCLALLDNDPSTRADGAALRAALRSGPPAPRPQPERVSFIGRAEERVALDAALGRVESGIAPGVVWVTGVSGIGKSALLRDVVSGWRASGRAFVAEGRCRESEHVPFRGFDRAIVTLLEHLRDREPGAARFPSWLAPLGLIFPAVAGLVFPGFGAEAPPPDPAESRRRAFEALRRLVATVGKDRPVVMVVDDLHWADFDGVQLCASLLAPPDAPPLLFVGATRPPTRGARGFSVELADRLSLANLPGGVCELRLSSLGGPEARGLVRAWLGEEAGDRAEVVLQEAAGHPFLIEEMSRALIEGQQETTRTAEPLEQKLGQVMAGRLRRLDAGARQLLEVITVATWPLRQRDAFAALEPGADGLYALHALVGRHFVLALRGGPDARLDVYHDRIREVVRADLPDEVRRRVSRRILEVAADDSELRAAQRVRLLADAGEPLRAADAALVAARSAEQQLAFAEAARLYDLARTYSPPEDAPLRREEEAAAWGAAGHPRRAADAWLHAARATSGDRASAARTRAVEHLLGGGYVDDGVRELQPLLDQGGFAWPGPRRALLVTVARLGYLALRGTRFTPRTSAPHPPRVLLRVDTCASVGQGLAVVDFARAGAFTLHGLLLALAAGEPRRVARGLAMVAAAILAPVGGVFARWGGRLLDQAEQIARELGDDYLSGLALVCRGQAELLAGRWQAGLDGFAAGEAILRERCVHAAWALDVSRMGTLRALEELGHLGEVEALADRTIAEAEGTGNVYRQVTGLLYAAYARLRSADVRRARAQVGEAEALWPHTGVHVQHFYLLRARAMCDLFAGEPEAAFRRLASEWDRLAAAGVFRVPISRIDGHLLRGRLAAALARAQPAEGGRLLDGVGKDIEVLRQESRPDARAAAALLGACVAALRGDLPGAGSGLLTARAGFEGAGMRAAVAVVDARLGEVEGDRVKTASALETLRSYGVITPEVWVEAHAPMALGPQAR